MAKEAQRCRKTEEKATMTSKVRNMPRRRQMAAMANFRKGDRLHTKRVNRERPSYPPETSRAPRAMTFDEFKATKSLNRSSSIVKFPSENYEKLEPSDTYLEDESAPELIHFDEDTELTWATSDMERAIEAAIYNVDIDGQKQIHVYAVDPKNYKDEEDGFASDKPESIIGHLIIERKSRNDIEFDHSFSWDYFEIVNPAELKRLKKIPHLYHGTPVDLLR